MPLFVKRKGGLPPHLAHMLMLPSSVRVFVSPNNPGVEGWTTELRAIYPELDIVQEAEQAGLHRRKKSMQRKIGLEDWAEESWVRKLGQWVVDKEAQVTTANSEQKPTSHFVLHLNEDTFVGQQGDALAEEIRSAMHSGVHVVSVHERDPHRKGCDFNRPFNVGQARWPAHVFDCHSSPKTHRYSDGYEHDDVCERARAH